MKTACFLTTFAIFISIAHASVPSPEVIYGKDNRKELYEVTNPEYLPYADATAAIVFPSTLIPMTGGGYTISSYKLDDYIRQCPDGRFGSQPSAAYCSAFLAAPDIMVTAGHCIMDEADCGSAKFVFHFAMNPDGTNPTMAKEIDVYSCKKVIKSKFYLFMMPDYAVIQLDRPVPHIKPLKLNTTGDVTKGDPLLLSGHPLGLPLKLADGAVVRKEKNLRSFFVANTDSFGGNSGSPVVNLKTGLVDGILVRGTRDFIRDRKNNCMRTKTCSEGGCIGERITKSSKFSKYIKEQQ